MTTPHDPDTNPTNPSYSQAETQASDQVSDHSGLERHAPLPATIGHYRIESLIGQGGMGAVYKAEQDSPRRTVALKVIKAGVASRSLLLRFEIEAQILGKLDHPGIATIYEAGTFDEGQGVQPFFAMEFIEGQELLDYADSKKLGTRDRLTLLAKIADAVQHAHQKGIIHRDLKPGNILVNNEGQVKVLDFGVARATDADIQTATMQTDIGQLIGTIPYMSPEQASGNPDDLDTRSDVYALGVIAYELLTGQMPYDLKQKMIHEAVRVIREDEPKTLSTINKTFRGDVEIIVSKALIKEKDRRYQSASDLGSDIERYLSNEPIEARPPSAWYQLSKFSKRNKALVAGIIAVLMVSVAGTLISINFAMGEAEQKQLALNAAEEARIAQEAAESAQAEEAMRADELQQVAEFQSNQLLELDPSSMGQTIRSGLASKLSEAATRKGFGNNQESEILEQYHSLVFGADFTGLALESLDEHIFEPSQVSINEQFADQPLVKARLLSALASTLSSVGLPKKASEILSEALDIRKKLLGEIHLDTLDLVNNLGDTYRDLGEYEQANAYYQTAQDGYIQVLSKEHPDTLLIMNNVAASYSDLAEFDKAKELLDEIITIQTRVLGANHEDTLLSIYNLSGSYRGQANYDEAERHNRIALDGLRNTLGNDDPITLTVMSSLGYILHATGYPEEALPLFEEAYESRRRVLGDQHPDTLGSIINMGNLHNDLGNPDQAGILLREAVETSQESLGADHPSTLMSKFMLGSFFFKSRNFTEAEYYTRQSLEGGRIVLGNNHPDTLASVNNMGAILRSQNKLEESEPFVQESLESNRREFGDMHPLTLVSIASMALLQQDLGNLSSAEEYMREALEGFRFVLGDQHRHTQTCVQSIAEILESQHKWSESAEYRKMQVQYQRDTSAGDESNLATALVFLALNHMNQNQSKDAQVILSECLEIRQRVMPENHWLIWNTQSLIGETLTKQSKFIEAEPLLIEAAEQIQPPEAAAFRRQEAIQRVVDLYTAWHAAQPNNSYDLNAQEWQQQIESLLPSE